MPRQRCDGAGLLDAMRSAVANLALAVDEINALNVFPVPDGDTGSNMLATARAALEEGEKVADQAADRVAGAISLGALMGARGNSGVITSQIFRGMSEGLGGKRRFNGLDLAHALTLGTRTAYAAVVSDVENTRNDPVPLHIRNAPTGLMKKLGYGKGYQYSHDVEGKVADMDCLPDSLKGRKYYHGEETGEETEVKRRLEEAEKKRGKKRTKS